MPALLLERLPLPSLEAYAIISVALLGWSLHLASEKTLNPDWKLQFSDMNNSSEVLPGTFQDILSQHWLSSRARDIILFSIHDSLCIWTVVNMAYCILVLIGNWLQKQVFGELRVSELQNFKDKFWNFVFYKFIFIFGIINVQTMEGVIIWGSWFSVIGFLHIHAQLCQDRFEYLAMTPCTSRNQHFRLLTLLVSILAFSGVLFFICLALGERAGWITFALVAPECLLLTLRTTHVIARYVMYLQSFQPSSSNNNQLGWNPNSYYIELVVEISCLLLDLAHHIHMLLRANMLLSMASLVIFMQLRVLYAQLCGRLRRHRNYRRMLLLVQTSCPLDKFECENEAEQEEKCAICWEAAAVARKLPCGHYFHHGCLLHWLEQDPSCPTCRRQLLETSSQNATSSVRPRESWSLAAWGRLLQHNVNNPPVVSTVENSSSLESLAEQLLQMFPDYPMDALIDDLRETHSVDATVENILEGRLLPMQDYSSFQNEQSNLLDLSSPLTSTISSQETKEKQFLENPQERQHILHSRKRDLLEEKRKLFIQRHQAHNVSGNS